MSGRLKIVEGEVSEAIQQAFDEAIAPLEDQELPPRRPGFARVELSVDGGIGGCKAAIVAPMTPEHGEAVIAGEVLDAGKGVVEFDIRKLSPGRALAVWLIWPDGRPQRVAVGTNNFKQ